MFVLGIGLVLCNKQPNMRAYELPDVTLAAAVVVATAGVVDPPLPPSGAFFPDLDQTR